MDTFEICTISDLTNRKFIDNVSYCVNAQLKVLGLQLYHANIKPIIMNTERNQQRGISHVSVEDAVSLNPQLAAATATAAYSVLATTRKSSIETNALEIEIEMAKRIATAKYHARMAEVECKSIISAAQWERNRIIAAAKLVHNIKINEVKAIRDMEILRAEKLPKALVLQECAKIIADANAYKAKAIADAYYYHAHTHINGVNAICQAHAEYVSLNIVESQN